MADKTTVTINKRSGATVSLEGDTVIVFAIGDAAEMIEGAKGMASRVVQTGEKIPTPIFADVISQIVTSLVKQTYKEQPMLAAYQLSTIADNLNEQCEMINGTIRNNAKDENDLDNMIEDLLKHIFD